MNFLISMKRKGIQLKFNELNLKAEMLQYSHSFLPSHTEVYVFPCSYGSPPDVMPPSHTKTIVILTMNYIFTFIWEKTVEMQVCLSGAASCGSDDGAGEYGDSGSAVGACVTASAATAVAEDATSAGSIKA